VAGGATLSATSVSVVGQVSVTGGSHLNVTGTTTTGAAPGTNPYATVTVPPVGTQCLQGSPFHDGQTIPAGTYCGGLAVSYGTVTIQPNSIIVVNGGSFAPAGGSTVNGVDVTIVLTGSSGNVATANIGNGVNLNLTAPSDLTVATHGIAILQSQGAGIAASTIAGGATMNIIGAMVFPSSVVQFSNGSTNSAKCTQLIAYQVQFSGGSRFGNNCAGTGVDTIGTSGGVSLVE
jgi:hypothetical protein